MSEVNSQSESVVISDELERLEQLRRSGALTEEEFQQAKQQVLNAGAFSGTTTADVSGKICGLESKIWITLMHLSQLLTWTVLGIAVPIVMWLLSKDESRDANRHGLVIVNWLLSSLVYGLIGLGLTLTVIFSLIGIPILIALGVLNIIFPIYGAIQANSGKFWKYPLSINFFNAEVV